MANRLSIPKIAAILLFVACFALQAAAQGGFYSALADSAATLTRDRVVYDGSYYSIKYPGGDVPAGRGVCTDVVIRAYRKVGIDLQKEVHEDMAANFRLYPALWGLSRPDANIDHRRVPNLAVFFARHGEALPVARDPESYLPGDIVTWMLPGNLPHIGIVSHKKSPDGKRRMIIHNIGAGQAEEDMLFDYVITGHYRYGRD